MPRTQGFAALNGEHSAEKSAPGEQRGYVPVEQESYGTTQTYGPFWSSEGAELNTTVHDWIAF